MEIAKILLQMLDMAIIGALAVERYHQVKAILDPIIAEGREPTPDEWVALRALDDTLDQRLDAAAARAREQIADAGDDPQPRG